MNRIATASFVIILISLVSTSMFMMNSSFTPMGSSFDGYEDVEESSSSRIKEISNMEVASFNNTFKPYEGEQTGSGVKALIGMTISVSNTYSDEEDKVPTFKVVDKLSDRDDVTYTAKFKSKNDLNDYIATLSKIRNGIDMRHEYTVEFNYNDDGFISQINLYYEK